MIIKIAGELLNPTDGALIPFLWDQSKDLAKETMTQLFLSYLHEMGTWLTYMGIPIFAHFAGIWGMICLLIAISGKGKWMERGVKSYLLSLMLEMVRYAV